MRVSKKLLIAIAGHLLLILGACGGGSSSNSEKPTGNNGTSSITSSSSSQATQQVLLSWSHPNSRVNGEYLELDEIGGYEIRYQLTNEGGDYIYLKLGALTTQLPLTELSLTELPLDANIEIATFDTQGLYSDFVPIQPH